MGGKSSAAGGWIDGMLRFGTLGCLLLTFCLHQENDDRMMMDGKKSTRPTKAFPCTDDDFA